MKALILAFAFKLNYHVLRLTHEAGYSVHVVGRDCAKGLKYSRFCASYQHLNCDPASHPLDAVREEIERAAAHVGADVILPSDVVSTSILVALKDRLSVPTYPLPSPALFDIMNDKWKFYHFCKEHNVPVPETMRFDDVKSLRHALAQGAMSFPIIVKPFDSMANAGIHVIENENDLHLLDKVDYKPILMQKYIRGELLCVAVLADRGRVVAQAIQRNLPDRYQFISHEKLLVEATRIVEASRYDGVALFDVMQDAATGAVYFLECNPRFWYSIFAAGLAGLNYVKTGLALKSLEAMQPLSAPHIQVARLKAVVLKWLKLSRLDEAETRTHKYLTADPMGALCNILPLYDDKRRHGAGSVERQVAALEALRAGRSS